MRRTTAAAHSCRTQKRAFHFYTPGVVRRSNAAARQVRAVLLLPAATTAAAAAAAVYRKFDDFKLLLIN